MRGNEKVLEERWHRGGGEIQPGVFDAFAGSEGVGELTEVAGGTLNEEDLEIVMVLEVNMHGRDDHEVVTVLNVGESALKISFPIVVDERDGACHRLRAEFLRVFDEAIAGHFGDCVGAAREFSTRDHVVEFVEQVGWKGYAETSKAWAAGGHGAAEGSS